jgi:DNA-binding transcriptional LysR family regulator
MHTELLSRLDLNLLIVFDAVMAEGSVLAAGRRLGMKSPAVSQALGRMRQALGHELFTRSSHGLRPTPFATSLWPGVRQALDLIRTSLTDGQPFNPTTAKRTFLLDFPSGTDALITPKLAARVANAPGLQFRISNARAFNVMNDLRFGDSWVALDYRPITEPGFRCELLTEQPLVVISKLNHPALAPEGLTTRLFQDLPQVAVGAVRSTAVLPVNERLAALGMTRNVQFLVPGLLSLLQMVAQHDVIATLPHCTALLCRAWGEVEIHPFPFKISDVSMYLVWHDHFDADPGHIWLRETVRDIFQQL